MEYKVQEAVFNGYNFPFEADSLNFHKKFMGLQEEIGHELDKNAADFLFTSYVYMLKARLNYDNRFASKKEFIEAQRYCKEYSKNYDIQDNLQFDSAFGANKYHKIPWDGYMSDNRAKNTVKLERSFKPQVSAKNDFENILNSECIKYAYDVVNDPKQVYWIRLQAKQFIEDFTVNQFDPEFEYYFNVEMLKVLEMFLRQINLATARDQKKIGYSIEKNVMPFQYFILANIFCWRRKDMFEENRFKRFVLFIPRKNGKSWLVSVIKMLGLILLPNESEFYTASNTLREAKQVRKEFINIIKASPTIKRYFRITNDEISALHSSNKFETLSGIPREGTLPSIATIDENGMADPANNVADSMRQGMTSSFQLMIYVSTAYEKYPSGMSVEVELAQSCLDPDSEHKDIETFAMLYTAQNPDIEWTSEEALEATNPLMWVTAKQDLITAQKQAMQERTKTNRFKTRRLNIFLATNSGDTITPVEIMKNCYEPNLDIDWRGKNCVLGIDLSQGDDNSVLALSTFVNGTYYTKHWVFVPRGRVQEKMAVEKVDYKHFEDIGQVILTTDEASNDFVVNYNTIEQFIAELPDKLGVRITHVAYDKFNADNMIQNLVAKNSLRGAEFRIIEQNKTHRHNGIALLRLAIYQKRLLFDNEMMVSDWGNVLLKQTDNLYYVEKVKTAKGKTDTVYALINALVICNELYEFKKKKSVTFFGTL